MDDERINRLRAEVLSALDAPGAAPAGGGLEARVAALEAAVTRLLAHHAPAGGAAPVRQAHATGARHASLQALDLGPGTDRCVMEPDKPCVQSHACRVLGH